MYNYIINISILSKTKDIEGWFKQLPELDRFEYRFKSYDTFSFEILVNSDIIICDLPYKPSQIKNRPERPDAIFILCAMPQVLQELSTNEYELFDDVWPRPLHQKMVEFYFSKTMALFKSKKDLRLSQTYLDSLIDSIPDLVWFKDLSGAHLKVNNSFCQAVGKSKNEIAGQYHYYIWDIPKEEYEAGDYVCLDTDEIVLQKKETCLFHENVKIKDKMRQLNTYKSLICSEDGEPMGTVGIARDVTDWVNMKAELEIILEHLPFSLLYLDANGIVLTVNNNFEKYFNLDRVDIVGNEYEKWANSVFLDYGKNTLNIYSEAIMIKNNEERIVEILREPVSDVFNTVTGYFYIFSDITVERNMSENLIRSANTDYLTALYNRRYLFEIIPELRSKHKLCLIYIDLDNFKTLNDQYGHTEGDVALISVARNLREQFPEQLIFRLGGDEFLVAVIIDDNKHWVINQIEKFLTCFSDKTRFPYEAVELSASIGIVYDADTFIDLDELLRRADEALYNSKQNGKNQFSIWTCNVY